MNPAEYLQAAKDARSRDEEKAFRSLCGSILKEHPNTPEASVARQLLDDDSLSHAKDDSLSHAKDEAAGAVKVRSYVGVALLLIFIPIAIFFISEAVHTVRLIVCGLTLGMICS